MIQIINYGAGNIRSVENALKALDESYEIISRPNQIRDDAKIIFPGVGAAGSAMENLRESGFYRAIPGLKQPFLGICLGMQLLLPYSEENETECLGIIPGKVKKFSLGKKIPQIGWNKVFITQDDPIFTDITDESYFYFVNSYYVEVDDPSILGKSFYGQKFISVIKRNNFYGTQFHPEKSGEIGMKLLSNFCKLC